MIELIVSDRCTNCGDCIAVCPTNVLDPGQAGPPILARVEDCQTCFMCELHCRADAIYVAPDCDRRISVTADEIVASGHLGQYRKHSGVSAGWRSGGAPQRKAMISTRVRRTTALRFER